MECSGGLKLYLCSDSILCVKSNKHIVWDRHLARVEVSSGSGNSLDIRFEKELNVYVDESYEIENGNKDLFI